MSQKSPIPHCKAGKCARLRRQAKIFRRLSGLSVEKFDELLGNLRPLFEACEAKRLGRRVRLRAIGGGRNYHLSLEDRLLLLLMYYRLYVSHAALGFLLEVDARTVGRGIQAIEPLLAQFFRIPERKIDLSGAQITQLFFEATEQPTQRPGQKAEQKRHYSGKKKRHTLKHQTVTDQRGKIRAVSRAYPGSIHDKKIYDREQVQHPPDIEAKGDRGYQVATRAQTCTLCTKSRGVAH